MSNVDVAALLDTNAAERLHIGGLEAKPGWQILNAQPGGHVDIVADLRDLSSLPDQAFDVVYASHTLEHLGYQRELPHALGALHRILRPGGRLMLSVPDLDTLCRLYTHEALSAQDRFHVMRMMFGGQMDEYDYHFVGLNFESLADFLLAAGFAQVTRVDELGVFQDSSTLDFRGVKISLNVVAVK